MPVSHRPTPAIPIHGAEESRITHRHRRRTRDVLTLWRTTERDRISAADVAHLADRLVATEISQERRWHAARGGDAAVAVAVAIDHLHRRTSTTPLTDLIVGSLLPLAKAGDATAALLVGHALRTLARLDPSDPTPIHLAPLWDRRPIDGRRTRCGSTRV